MSVVLKILKKEDSALNFVASTCSECGKKLTGLSKDDLEEQYYIIEKDCLMCMSCQEKYYL